MNGALRRLFEKHSSGTSPLPTTLDLYRKLLIDWEMDDNIKTVKIGS